jgi:uncharacterized protein YggU (UPF0235/DUF167 family)
MILAIRLTPRAKRERIGGLFADADGRRWFQASVAAPPDKGKANAALIALLAKSLKHPASSILLETGDASRLKRLRLLDCTPATEQALKQFLSEERNEQ